MKENKPTGLYSSKPSCPKSSEHASSQEQGNKGIVDTMSNEENLLDLE